MALYFVGLGLNNENDISIKGLEAIKKCDYVFLEGYTSKLGCKVEDLSKLYGKEVKVLYRKDIEENPETIILDKAKDNDVAFLVIGDIFSATTHLDLWVRAKKLGIKTHLIHNASILTAISVTGLQIYNFGKTTSVPFPQKNWEPDTPYNVLEMNLKNGLHTLLLLDLDPQTKKFMFIKEAIDFLFKIEKDRKKSVFTEDTMCLGCARIGSDDPTIFYGKAKDVMNQDFGKAPYCLVVPGKLHFFEEEVLHFWELVEK